MSACTTCIQCCAGGPSWGSNTIKRNKIHADWKKKNYMIVFATFSRCSSQKSVPFILLLLVAAIGESSTESQDDFAANLMSSPSFSCHILLLDIVQCLDIFCFLILYSGY